MQDNGNSFLEFCEARQSDLRRIARQSREFCFDDMQGEAWLIAERIALAEHLRIVLATLRSRIAWSCRHMKIQPSLFDRVQAMASDFVPTQARLFATPTSPAEAPTVQMAWDFA